MISWIASIFQKKIGRVSTGHIKKPSGARVADAKYAISRNVRIEHGRKSRNVARRWGCGLHSLPDLLVSIRFLGGPVIYGWFSEGVWAYLPVNFVRFRWHQLVFGVITNSCRLLTGIWHAPLSVHFKVLPTWFLVLHWYFPDCQRCNLSPSVHFLRTTFARPITECTPSMILCNLPNSAGLVLWELTNLIISRHRQLPILTAALFLQLRCRWDEFQVYLLFVSSYYRIAFCLH